MISEYKLEGIREANQKTLIRLLEQRFGKLNSAVKSQIREIESSRKLERLLSKVLDAESLDDFNF